MDCIICAYPIDGKERLRTVTACSHDEPICSICYLRLRSLQRNFHCPTCKRELDNVICTAPDMKSQYSDYIIRNRITIDNVDNYIFDPKGQMFFPKDHYDEVVKALWTFQCSICPQVRKDFKQLRGHLINEHNLHMCNLCGEFKQVFPKEHKLYSQQQYDQHIRYGDKDGSNGHPLCEFCKKRFYDSSALFFHLRNDHFSCHLCEQAGIKFRYFNNYADLENHFRLGHFLCDDPACLERRFVVFSNEIDLFAHRKSFHPHLAGDRAIPLHFQYRRGDNVVNSTGERVGNEGDFDNSTSTRNNNPYNESMRRERFEGGLGGRALNGEWQVELQPTTTDPRDPNRHLRRQQQGMNREDFPELLSANPATGNSLVLNRWMSVKESGGSNNSSKGIKNGGNLSAKLQGKGNDFPSLPGKPTPTSTTATLKPAAAKVTTTKKKQTTGKDMSSDIRGVLNYMNSLAEDEGPASTRPSTVVDSLGNWVNVKVDNRLKKKKNNHPAAASKPSSSMTVEEDDKVGDSNLSPKEQQTKSYVNNDEQSVGTLEQEWNSTGYINSQEAFSFDLAKALHDSLEDFNSKQLDTATETSLREYQKEKAFPVLPAVTAEESIGSRNSVSPPRTSVKEKKKSTNNNKSKPAASSDWQSALKSVGMSGHVKTKKSAGITVIKPNNASDANKKLSVSNNRREELASSSWRKDQREAETFPIEPPTSVTTTPPPPPSQSEETGSGSNSRKYGGWVKLAGAEEPPPAAVAVSHTMYRDETAFPNLSSKK